MENETMEVTVGTQEPTVHREQQDGDGSALISNAHKRRKLGFDRYANSEMLSDVTIRYGHSGEHAFRAHKIILGAKSSWFEAAFTGNFMESNSKEITLKEDDPKFIEAMLRVAYTENFRPSEVESGIDGALYCIGMYRVADKYDFPMLEEHCSDLFERRLSQWLSRDGDHNVFGEELACQQKFCEIVTEVYKLPHAGLTHPLVASLLRTTDDVDTIRILGNTGQDQPLLVYAAKEVANFGRDLFLHLISKVETTEDKENGNYTVAKLHIGKLVCCPSCGRDWTRVADEHDFEDHYRRNDDDACGHCWNCGYETNWGPLEWFP